MLLFHAIMDAELFTQRRPAAAPLCACNSAGQATWWIPPLPPLPPSFPLSHDSSGGVGSGRKFSWTRLPMLLFINTEMLYSIRHQGKLELEQLLDKRGREWCLRQASKSILDLVWPWPLTDRQSWPFHAYAPLTSCANLHKNRFIRFQNIVITSLVTDGRTDGRTNGNTDNPRT